MIEIKTIKLGLPQKDGVKLLVRILPFETNSKTCSTYYEVQSEVGEVLVNGNYQLTEDEFSLWGEEMEYIENLLLNYLKLDRL